MVVVRRHRGRQHHVLGRRVRMSRESVVRMRMVQFGDERAGVAALRTVSAEGGQRRRRKITGGRGGGGGSGGRRGRGARRRAAGRRAVGGRQQRADAEVGLSGQLQEGVVGHLAAARSGLFRGRWWFYRRVETHLEQRGLAERQQQQTTLITRTWLLKSQLWWL